MTENKPDAVITTLENGRKVVDILTVRFSGKRRIDWDGVELYLKKYIGKSYVIDETDDPVINNLIKCIKPKFWACK